MTPTTPQRKRALLIAATTTLGLITACTPGNSPNAPTSSPTKDSSSTKVKVYLVEEEGLTKDGAASLAQQFGIQNALAANGAFEYIDPIKFAYVPVRAVGESKDESGQLVQNQELDLDQIAQLKVFSENAALDKARALGELEALSPDFATKATVSHTTLTLADEAGANAKATDLDTAVTFGITLHGLPVTGQGARLRISFAGDGSVTQLSRALRKLKTGESVDVISPEDATAACAALYPPGVDQDTPTLGYQFPELTATNVSGKGTVQKIFPQYTCHPRSNKGAVLAERLLPAVKDSAPVAVLEANRSGTSMKASVKVSSGTAPYTLHWSTTSGVTSTSDSMSYERTPREGDGPEQVAVEVTDANGLSATAVVTLEADGTKTANSVPGGGGFAVLSTGRLDVGAENTVDEWDCAQASAQGFKEVMASHSVPTQFDWRGANAWERDFKDPANSGYDSSYVDDVDMQWYTGHGSPDSFTFKSDHDDRDLTPADAKWGNRDLEWLQLESCQVLRDTNGLNDYFGRWGPAISGLHMINGFHTNARCVGGGTGRTFAENLFPWSFLFWSRPAMTVRTAWAHMALSKEPGGTVYRSMGPIGAGGATNIGDYFWGQGPTTADITVKTGYWAIAGTV